MSQSTDVNQHESLPNTSEVFCDDCLNPCDEWEYEFGYPDCHARQDRERTSKWQKTMTMGEWYDSRQQLSKDGMFMPQNDRKDVANDSD